jgi:Domain of unknown function (DUF4136)
MICYSPAEANPPENPMKLFKFALLTLGLTLLAACASQPPKPMVDFSPNHDFSQDKRIGLYARSGGVTGRSHMTLTPFQEERINQALRRALESKGFVFVNNPRQADLLISWHLNLTEKTDVKTFSEPASIGMAPAFGRYNRYAMYNCFNCMNQTDVRVTEYTQGTFIVDMIDPRKQASVWRSVTQSKLKGEMIKDQERLNDAAELVLGDFPPGVSVSR